MLSDAQLSRYSRQILLHDFDVAGQERLLAARVLIVGLGGLGLRPSSAPVLGLDRSLARSGVAGRVPEGP